MPLNTLRLNALPSSHPNPRVVFIKPLPRPPPLQTEYDTADTFLRAIAAQCLPIMKSHYLSVTTLEEHEPNREFIGRNFNSGEIIQLVLRSKSGAWLPFNMVQMVMMHELAHNTHMNHGKGFWAERNKYAEEMKGLWAKGYTGEGFWGSGRSLRDMQAVMGNNIVDSEVLKDLPLCGGTYRSRRRKRKTKQDLTWKEKRDKRIEKKFGKNGTSLGEDEDQRLLLEIGRKGPIGGKPRVAQSNRGRELRAAAALARFDTNKKEVKDPKEEGDIKSEDTTDSDDYEDADGTLENAIDTNGQRLQDGKGNSMVRVCGDDDGGAVADDVYIKQEIEELEGLDRYFPPIARSNGHIEDNFKDPLSIATDQAVLKASNSSDASTPSLSILPTYQTPSAQRAPLDPASAARLPQDQPLHLSFSICSLSNPSSPTTLTCSACAHVLHPDRDKDCWPCPSSACRELGSGTEMGRSRGYINAGDVGVCGICGERRP